MRNVGQSMSRKLQGAQSDGGQEKDADGLRKWVLGTGSRLQEGGQASSIKSPRPEAPTRAEVGLSGSRPGPGRGRGEELATEEEAGRGTVPGGPRLAAVTFW